MSRAPRSRALRPSGQGIGYSREFLEHLAHILVDAGHSPKKLARLEGADAKLEPGRSHLPGGSSARAGLLA